MSQYLTNKVEVLVDDGTSFASAITTKEIELNNYQSAKLVVNTSEGDETTTNAKVVAILSDATEVEIKTEKITIGGNKQAEINIVANEIAHYDATKVKISIDAVDGTDVTGGVVAILGEPRYAVEVETETTEETDSEE